MWLTGMHSVIRFGMCPRVKSFLSEARAKSRGTSAVVTASCLCLALAACASTDSVQPVVDAPRSAPPSEEAIEKGVKQVFTAVKLVGAPEISELRRAIPSSPAEWLVCLRSNVPPFHTYALFFDGNKMANYRLAVLYDGCVREMYMPAAPATAGRPAQR
jgi:hypothetical protein